MDKTDSNSPQILFRCKWFDCSAVTDSFESYKSHVMSHYSEHMEAEHLLRCLWKDCELQFASHQPVLQLFRHLLSHCHIERLMYHGELYRQKNNLPECQLTENCSRELLAYNLDEPSACQWNECPYRTDDIDEYFCHVNKHLKRFPDERGSPWLCYWENCQQAIDKKVFKNSGNLKVHLLGHTKEKRFACMACRRQFVNSENFRDHFHKQDEWRMQTEKDRYQCKECHESFPRRPLLTSHMQAFHSKSKKKCTSCLREFPNHAKLQEHVRSIHSPGTTADRKPIQCPYCHYTYKTRRGILEHVRSKHDGSVMQCLDCDFETRIYSKMWRHVFSKHQRRHYACHICGFRATTPFRFSRHLRNKHNLTPGPGFQRFRYHCSDAGVFQVVTNDLMEERGDVCDSEALLAS